MFRHMFMVYFQIKCNTFNSLLGLSPNFNWVYLLEKLSNDPCDSLPIIRNRIYQQTDLPKNVIKWIENEFTTYFSIYKTGTEVDLLFQSRKRSILFFDSSSCRSHSNQPHSWVINNVSTLKYRMLITISQWLLNDEKRCISTALPTEVLVLYANMQMWVYSTNNSVGIRCTYTPTCRH